MRIDPLGDSALILRNLVVPAYELAEALNQSPPKGLFEAVASYETVGLFIDPQTFNPDDLTESRTTTTPRAHQVPVCYALGEDLDDAANALNLTIEALIQAHTGTTYRCYAVGFCPGFPYLGYLPPEISGVPRRSQPRARVTPGSVGITGRQTGIYPLERPGGWSLIGRTPLEIVNEEDGYFPIQAGDEVRFVSIEMDEFERLKGERL